MADKQVTDASSEQATAQARSDGLMHVKIYAPYKVYYNDDAVSISAVNDTGPFDVLGLHHNFISLLNPCDIQVKTPDGKEEAFTIQRGIMHVKADEVIVFLDV